LARRFAFTQIELLVVIAFLAVSVALQIGKVRMRPSLWPFLERQGVPDSGGLTFNSEVVIAGLNAGCNDAMRTVENQSGCTYLFRMTATRHRISTGDRNNIETYWSRDAKQFTGSADRIEDDAH